jgi:hypothetical protein
MDNKNNREYKLFDFNKKNIIIQHKIKLIVVENGCANPFFCGTSQLLNGNVYLFI